MSAEPCSRSGSMIVCLSSTSAGCLQGVEVPNTMRDRDVVMALTGVGLGSA